jgi:HEAT repeat protein
VPLATQLGGALVPALMDALGTEEDRNRRGRLVRVLKGIGNPAHPLLLDALQSQTWYVVRNTLNILGEFGERDHAAAIGRKLQHGDARVRRAAARALGKIGGVESESLLVGAVGDRDAETQREVLLCLASMKAQSAVPALGELAKSRSLASEARELVISTLAQIGSASAVPALGEVVKPKGIFARESLPIRLAAARALAQIGTADAKQILRSTIAAESDRAAREAFTKITPQT